MNHHFRYYAIFIEWYDEDGLLILYLINFFISLTSAMTKVSNHSDITRKMISLQQVNASENDMALALNRYIGSCVLPILTNYSHFFSDADHASALLDSTLNTVYRLSKCQSLTKGQMDAVSNFLISFTKYVFFVWRSHWFRFMLSVACISSVP